MLSQQIRRAFLNYFKNKGHTIVPSSSVVPHDDPTLLFTNAGMNQFKDVFLGSGTRDYVRATTSQKCIRVGGKHNDLENVGHTSRHLTFFEMLGNFSFGDYFKKEAIAFAWEVALKVFEFEPERLWITVFREDDEAFELWQKHVPVNRIVRMDEKDNFWAMGETGPCGPCSELYFDRGSKFGSATHLKEDVSGERYMEFWNLVFMQFNRDADGEMHPLPKKSIDTGSGLERVVSLKMEVDNVFLTDILRHIIARIETVLGKKYDPHNKLVAPAFHVIADHIRALAFSMADGAQPSNVDRGYVLRKLIRRSVRYARTVLGREEPFLANILPALIEMMGEDYPELNASKNRIAELLTLEEENFLRTLKRGGNILTQVIEKATKSPMKQISGEDAFKLKDTYGFPLEEILLVAKDSNLQVNLESYQLLEEKAKEISRSARTTQSQEAQESQFEEFVKKNGPSQFVGYTDMRVETEVLGILQDGVFVTTLSEGSEGWVILRATPFYPEKGGQVADTGQISHAQGSFEVDNCMSPFPDLITHHGKVERGRITVGDKVVAAINEKRRLHIAAHHTATHLLHWALQQILGSHIRQAGSLVEPDRLRFDFNHHKALSEEEIKRIEDLVNEKIRDNQTVTTYEISYEQAQNRSDIKQFFGEKYRSQVRVVDINFSKELCGGTHAYHVGMLGYFRITKESSIASGVRRIEACCGRAAEQFVRNEEHLMQEAATLLKTATPKLGEKIGQLLEENSQLKLQMRTLKRQQLKGTVEELAKKTHSIKDYVLITELIEGENEDLDECASQLLNRFPKAVVALAIRGADKVQLLIKVSSDLVKEGLDARVLIKEVASAIGGGGGGRPEAAQAGGKNPSGIEQAFKTLHMHLKK